MKQIEKCEDGSVIPGVEAMGTTTAIENIGTQGNKKVLAPVIDSDAMNTALFAARNPRMAMIEIRKVVFDLRWMVRNDADKTEISCALNKIVRLTGGLA